ncbi:MAG: N-acetylmuramoyl-L-alanine amidase, partial [Clostridia bacterium]|nr:N-acetylmuramoyl-L-alanine amidase [Clostridia bacterium]
GHGGSDTGAAANGIQEKVINLAVAKKVRELLHQHSGIEVRMSRETDVYVDLNERCRMANQWGADYFISVHHNAGGGDGYEVIHSIYHGKGEQLAHAVGDEFGKTGQNCRRIFSRQGQNGDYYCVIRETNMPAIITEFAFLDTKDVEAVDTTEELYAEATAIARGFCSFVGIALVESKPASEIQKPQAQDPETWKLAGINGLADAGLLLDREGWSKKVNEPMPVWAATLILYRIFKELKGGA